MLRERALKTFLSDINFVAGQYHSSAILGLIYSLLWKGILLWLEIKSSETTLADDNIVNWTQNFSFVTTCNQTLDSSENYTKQLFSRIYVDICVSESFQ